jgi:long-subunit fatty acid transport protein
MKRIIIITAAVILSSFIVMAQTEFDALKLVENDINGTARYISMAGAFGALGGDPSAIKDNPAGLGIFRKSELTGTLNAFVQRTKADWNGETANDDLYKLNLNNVSLILAVPTWRRQNGTSGLLNSNWAFNYNRLNNFNRSLNAKSGLSNSSITDYIANFSSGLLGDDMSWTEDYEPFDNIQIPWISLLAYNGYLINETSQNSGTWNPLLNDGEKVTPSYSLEEKGFVDEYSLGWSGNFSNIFFLGATINMKSIEYKVNSVFSESFGGGGGLSLANDYSTSGAGVNLNLGAIFVPVDFMRVGLSLHSPTIYTLTDNYYAKMNYDSGPDKVGWITTPEDGYSEYKIQSPLQYDISVAFIAGTKGLLSAEYSASNYSGTRLMSIEGNTQEFNFENDGMREMINNARTIKVGGEYKVTDNFAIRAGYANSSSPTKPTAVKLMRDNTMRTDTEYFLRNRTDYLSAGFGYQESNWHIDFAFMNKIQDESYYPYNANNLGDNLKVTPAKVITSNNNLVVTLGFKF